MEQEFFFTIDRLIAVHFLEPGIREIYVEGRSDKNFLDWFFSQIGILGVDIFEIDCVEITTETLKEYSLAPSNRSEVIALALEIDKSTIGKTACVYCVADSDFDFILDNNHKAKRLLYTDYTSLDMYFCTKEVIEKVLKVAIGKMPKNFSTTFKNFLFILEKIFLIRAANIELGWGCRIVPFLKSCKFNKGAIVFNYDGYLEKVLQTEEKSNEKQNFEKAVSNLKNKKTKSYQYRIRGHDFISLLGWYVSKLVSSGGLKYKDEKVMRAIVVMSVDANMLLKYKLFKKLRTAYS